jgi:hypothetical protein
MARDEGGTLARLKACRNGSLEDVFELQDKIAVSVAGVIEPALQAAAEMRRSAARPTIDLTAYALYLRALAAFYPITQERIFEALGLLRGTKLVRRLRPRSRTAHNCLLSALDPAERDQFVDLLVRVVESNGVFDRPGAGRRTRATAAPA